MQLTGASIYEGFLIHPFGAESFQGINPPSGATNLPNIESAIDSGIAAIPGVSGGNIELPTSMSSPSPPMPSQHMPPQPQTMPSPPMPSQHMPSPPMPSPPMPSPPMPSPPMPSPHMPSPPIPSPPMPSPPMPPTPGPISSEMGGGFGGFGGGGGGSGGSGGGGSYGSGSEGSYGSGSGSSSSASASASASAAINNINVMGGYGRRNRPGYYRNEIDIYKSTPIHRTNIYPQKVVNKTVYAEQNKPEDNEKMIYWFIIILILIGIGIYIPKFLGGRRRY